MVAAAPVGMTPRTGNVSWPQPGASSAQVSGDLTLRDAEDSVIGVPPLYRAAPPWISSQAARLLDALNRRDRSYAAEERRRFPGKSDAELLDVRIGVAAALLGATQ
jgi:hypothetical protein